MQASFVDDLRSSLGLTSRQMADLLWINRSGLTMAASGHRPMPGQLLPWLTLLQEIADAAPSPGENGWPNQRSFAGRQLRLLHTELAKNELQQERVDARLEKAERLCTWLPQLLESAICKADENRQAAAALLLRQSQEQRQQYWEQSSQLHARLAALNAAIAHWQTLI